MSESIENGWYSLESYRDISVGDNVYIADIMPDQGTYETTEAHIRSIRSNDNLGKTYLIALENNKYARSRTLQPCDIGTYVFLNEHDCDLVVEDAKAENRDVEVSKEVFYDE